MYRVFQIHPCIGWRRLVAVAGACACVAAGGVARAGGDTFQEHDVKAVFLFNFVQFADWPAESFSTAEAPFDICVVGDRRVGEALRVLSRGESLCGRSVRVVQVSTLAEADRAHLLFVGSGAMPERGPLAAPGERPHALIVGERADVLRRGAAIRLLAEGGRMRFEICPDAATARGVQLRARLLRLARIVECAPE